MRFIEKSRTAALSAGLVCAALASVGCASDVVRDDERPGALAAEGEGRGSAKEVPTWYADVAPIVGEKCNGCHQEGGIAPFPLTSYEQAKRMAGAMIDAVEKGRMPPFLAEETPECKPPHFLNDRRLSAAQKATVRAWVDAGTPEGDRSRAAPIPPSISLALAREDMAVRLPKPITVEHTEHGDVHTCMIVDPALAEDIYVTGRQLVPGNKRVLHHFNAYIVQPKKPDGTPLTKAQIADVVRAKKGVALGERWDCFGGLGLEGMELSTELLTTWSPGGAPNVAPRDSAQPIAKDSLLLLNFHYHPLDHAEVDADTYLALTLSKERPAYISRPIMIGNIPGRYDLPSGVAELVKQPGEERAQFVIPAGAKNHVEEMTWTWKLKNPLRVYGAGSHMHFVGRDQLVTLENAKPRADEEARECLIHTPKWNYNWQGRYYYDASYEDFPQMDDGDVLRIRCIYDNSTDNPFVRKALAELGLPAPIDVKLGENTLDEMCLGGINIIYPNPTP